jgi:hypothetical protein
MVILTRTRATRNQNDVGAGRHNRFTNGCDGAIDAALVGDEAAVAGDQAREQRSICVVNCPAQQRCPGFAHTASSDDATYARAAHDRDWANTGRHQKSDVSGAHFAARLREPASPHGLAAGAFDVGTGNNRFLDVATSIDSVHELIRRNDSIGTARQPIACMYEDPCDWRKIVVVQHRPKRKRIVNACADSLVGAKRKPIHGRTVKRWQVDCCCHVMRQNPTQRIRNMDVFCRQRFHLVIDPGQHVVKPCSRR